MVQTFLHVAVPTGTAATFPFEKLPLELQRQIIRETVLEHGFRPKPTIPAPWDQKDIDPNGYWSENECDFFIDYLECLEDETADSHSAMVPLNLLKVSKTVANFALSIHKEEMPMVINIATMSLHFLNTLVNNLPLEYPSYKELTRVRGFLPLRNFELNLNFDSRWWGDAFDLQIPLSQWPWWQEPKEWLRTICDILATNDTIEKLSVRLPCLCTLITPGHIARAEIVMLDVLAPLRQLRVVEPVQFVWQRCQWDNYENGTCTHQGHCCTAGLGEGLLKILQTTFVRLTGEELSHHEEIWKNLKALPRVPEEWRGQYDRFYGETLEGVHNLISYIHYRPPEGIQKASFSASKEIRESNPEGNQSRDNEKFATPGDSESKTNNSSKDPFNSGHHNYTKNRNDPNDAEDFDRDACDAESLDDLRKFYIAAERMRLSMRDAWDCYVLHCEGEHKEKSKKVEEIGRWNTQ
ncbi:MAG: hypothetical protein Q9172_003888 [Xanthocarpia lactea]